MMLKWEDILYSKTSPKGGGGVLLYSRSSGEICYGGWSTIWHRKICQFKEVWSFCTDAESIWTGDGLQWGGVCNITPASHCLSVSLSSSHTFLVVTHSYVSQATHAFLGLLPLCFSYQLFWYIMWRYIQNKRRLIEMNGEFFYGL